MISFPPPPGRHLQDRSHNEGVPTCALEARDAASAMIALGDLVFYMVAHPSVDYDEHMLFYQILTALDDVHPV
jgi:hypothetical protein